MNAREAVRQFHDDFVEQRVAEDSGPSAARIRRSGARASSMPCSQQVSEVGEGN